MLLHNNRYNGVIKNYHTNNIEYIFVNIIYLTIYFFVLLSFFNLRIALADEEDEEFFSQSKTSVVNTKSDPFIKFNRKIFNFNVLIYDNILIPFDDWYEKNIPLGVRWTFKNYMENWTERPNDVILSILDFDIEGILVSYWKFFVNTVFGLFGGDDVAYFVGLKSYKKSIGNILHFYHIPTGPYFMLPLLGPSNIRDSFGLVGYYFLTSSFWMKFIIGNYSNMFAMHNVANPFWFIFHNSSNDLININFAMSCGYYFQIFLTKGSTITFLSNSAIDRYVSFRTAYWQNLELEEKRYENLRFNGSVEILNKCDYEAHILLPEECEDDPKSYSLSL